MTALTAFHRRDNNCWPAASSWLFCLLIMAVCWPISAAGADTVLIRNVRLLDRNDESDGVRVNMLISGINLEIITRDELPADDAALVVDAQNGFLLGRLNIGQPSSFLIFDADPRKDIDVLLDTKVHARFVMRAGVILKNTLPEPAAANLPTEPVRNRPSWLAYTPPPLALPMSYLDETKWNRWEGKAVSGIFIAASLIDRQKWLSQDSASTSQIGDLSEFNAGEVRGLRFGSVGTINFDKPWVYTVFAASNAFSNGFDSDSTEGFSLFDYRLDIPVFSALTLSVGKQKEPISMQRLMPLTNTPMQERSSAADGMLRSRNFGAVLSGTVFN